MKVLGRDGFLTAIDRLIGQQESKLLKTLEIIIEQCDKERQRWHNSKGNRTEIINKTSKSEPTVNRYIGRLTEAEILLKLPDEGRGIYKINPKYLEILK